MSIDMMMSSSETSLAKSSLLYGSGKLRMKGLESYGTETMSPMSTVTTSSVEVQEVAKGIIVEQLKHAEVTSEKQLADVLDLTMAGPEARRKLMGTSAALVRSRKSLLEVLDSFMKAFTTKNGWRYAELWSSAKECADDRNAVLEMSHSIVTGDEVGLRKFSNYSRQLFIVDKECMPGRIWRTGSVEWMGCATDSRSSTRADMAFRSGIVSGFGVPVILGTEVVAVMCFFDNRHHSYDAKSIHIASQCISSLTTAWQATNLRRESANVPVAAA
ncbi:hypothetical protein NDN08_007708 [Rhodosorus marinus]|uniref:GAF domain-containing protein n=1 Tax=Rhodosorus marinus TaxID=101924 RepID=A0AAV8V2G2_9RHOD|nr:hypothetical protein NDN08_007708 [Rhodosorus marinus]